MLKKFREKVDLIEGKPITRKMAKYMVLMPYIVISLLIITLFMVYGAYTLGCLSSLSR